MWTESRSVPRTCLTPCRSCIRRRGRRRRDRRRDRRHLRLQTGREHFHRQDPEGDDPVGRREDDRRGKAEDGRGRRGCCDRRAVVGQSHVKLDILLPALVLLLLPAFASAQELEPGAYWPIPVTLNVVTVSTRSTGATWRSTRRCRSKRRTPGSTRRRCRSRAPSASPAARRISPRRCPSSVATWKAYIWGSRR